jgi:REP element-mobilizing transposase RayT
VELIEIGGVEDHIHVLVQLPAPVSVSELMKQIKGASSHLVTHEVSGGGNFKWQGAYAAFSVSETDLPAVRAYIRNQKKHHAQRTLRTELEIDEQ